MQHRLETVWVAPVRLGKSGIIYIVDKNGKLVAHPTKDPALQHNYSSVQISQRTL